MTGLELFDVCERRHGGNAESRDAAARAELRRSHYHEALRSLALRAGHDGLTLAEAASTLGKGKNEISGRFTELKGLGGLVVKAGNDGKAERRDGCAVYLHPDVAHGMPIVK